MGNKGKRAVALLTMATLPCVFMGCDKNEVNNSVSIKFSSVPQNFLDDKSASGEQNVNLIEPEIVTETEQSASRDKQSAADFTSEAVSKAITTEPIPETTLHTMAEFSVKYHEPAYDTMIPSKQQSGHLSKSEPPQFGQRQVLYYNPLSNAALRFINLNFKIDTKIKTIHNRILNMEKG